MILDIARRRACRPDNAGNISLNKFKIVGATSSVNNYNYYTILLEISNQMLPNFRKLFSRFFKTFKRKDISNSAPYIAKPV